MIPRKLPQRDFPAEYAARTEGRMTPEALRPGFTAPQHPDPERKLPEAPAAELDLPEGLKEKKDAETVARAPVADASDAEARATSMEGDA